MSMEAEALEELKQDARESGFDWFAYRPAEPLREELANFRAWIDKGLHGEMQWLEKDPERRCDPSKVVEGCETVIVLGMNYLRKSVDEPESPGMGKISKYARTRDYHRVIEKRLKKLCRRIDEDYFPGSTSRGYVDYGPVMERAHGTRAGLGFIGKHTLLIHPKEGSFHFLSAILTTAKLPEKQSDPIVEGCGNCRRCIDACPTDAITEPWKLDARRCLSYLTIEKEGAIDEEFWPHFEGNIFGCDICQNVCPYNQSRAEAIEESPLGEWLFPQEISLERAIRYPEKIIAQAGQYATPLRRAGAESLRRNAVIVASVRGELEELHAIIDILEHEEMSDWLRETCEKALGILHAKLQDSH